jgi:hypothetical protein
MDDRVSTKLLGGGTPAKEEHWQAHLADLKSGESLA